MKNAKIRTTALNIERRKNRRLRKLINDLHELINDLHDLVLKNRHDLDLQFKRLSQLQAAIDLRKTTSRH